MYYKHLQIYILLIKKELQNFYLTKLKMQILYELKDFETLLYIIDSYRHFLKNYCKIFIETNPKINLNFVKYLKRLVDIQSGKKIKPDELRFEIEHEKIITSRNWLLEKTNELIK